MSVNAATRYMGIKMTKKELKQRFSNLYKKRESFYESHRDMAAKIGFEDWRKNEFFQYFCEGAKDLEKENAELKERNEAQGETIAFYLIDHEEKAKRIAELEGQIEKMRCCENCKYNSYWGNELHCNYGLKEAIKEDKLVECNKMDKWEMKEK